MPTRKYQVQIREVHINLVEVEIEVNEGESEDEIRAKALDEALNNSSDKSIELEYSHTMDEDYHVVERIW